MTEIADTQDHASAAATIIRGRDSELSSIGERLADALAGRGSVASVVGDAGMGKSRLLQEARRMARRLAVTALAGGASPDRELAPMALLLRTLEPIIAPQAVARARSGPGERLALLELTEAHLERHALDRPVLVAIDDLQWADPTSVWAIGELIERLAGLPVCWLLASRQALASPVAREMRIGPLAPDAVAAVLRDTLGVAPGPRLLRLAESAGGNAHSVVELATGLIAEGLVASEDRVADLTGAELPRRVGDAMRIRLGRLSVHAAEVVRAGAVAGRRTHHEVLAELTATPDRLELALRELREAGLAVANGPGLTFPHDLLRDAVLATLTQAQRRTLNRRLVDILLARGSTPAQVAPRLAASASPGDAAATALLLRAARSVASTSAAAAAALAQRGYELAAEADPSRAALAAETTLLLHAANRPDEARAFARRTLDGVLSDEDRGELLLSIAWLFDTHTDSQLQAGQEALGLKLSPELRARHLTRHVAVLFTAGERERCSDLIDATRDALAPFARAGMRFQGVVAEASYLWSNGRYTDGLRLVGNAQRLTVDPGDLGFLAHWRADFLHLTDRTDAAAELIAERAELARRDGQTWEAMLWEQKRGRLLLETGRPLEALATLEGLYARTDVEPSITDTMALVALGRAATHTGDRNQQRAALAPLELWLASSTAETRREGALLLLVVALAANDGAGLRRALDTLTETGRLELPICFADECCAPQVVRAARCVDRPDVAWQAIEWQAALVKANPDVPSIAGALAHAQALLDGHDFETAVGVLEGSPRPLLLAAVLEDADSVDALERALGLYARAGALADERRVLQRLRQLGVRHTPRRSGRGGPLDELTDTETSVARLVADGLTNRQTAARLYLSPHTVNTHLRHIFDKLGLRSRMDLVRLMSTTRTPMTDREDLTPAQRRVALRVADGMTNHAIAAELGISAHTVSSHLRETFRKLNVRTRTELASVLRTGPESQA